MSGSDRWKEEVHGTTKTSFVASWRLFAPLREHSLTSLRQTGHWRPISAPKILPEFRPRDRNFYMYRRLIRWGRSCRPTRSLTIHFRLRTLADANASRGLLSPTENR